MDIKVLQKDMIAAMKARDKARKESISALTQDAGRIFLKKW